MQSSLMRPKARPPMGPKPSGRRAGLRMEVMAAVTGFLERGRGMSLGMIIWRSLWAGMLRGLPTCGGDPREIASDCAGAARGFSAPRPAYGSDFTSATGRKPGHDADDLAGGVVGGQGGAGDGVGVVAAAGAGVDEDGVG